MRAFQAARAGTSSRLFGAFALVASLGLTACSDIDNAMFGTEDNGGGQAASSEPGTLSSSDTQPSQQVASNPAPAAAAPPSYQAPAASAPSYPAEQQSSSSVEAGTLPSAQPAPSTMSPVGGTMGGITPVQIEAGSNTGTAVSNMVANLRSQLVSIEEHIGGNQQRLAGLHAQAGENSTAYHEAKAHITARLQAGTTRGNPELVAEWNTAQASLDQLSANINALSSLGTVIANDSSSAHYVLDQVTATFNVSGAVDEDHRQLSVLEDETNQTIILIDRLLRNVSDDVQRQTAYTANERANLTTLAGAIKNGELYGGDLGGAPMLAMSTASSTNYGGTPLVVIRFDHNNVEYQQILYAALSQALQTRPGAGFSVVAVSPTRGTVTAVQLAQTAAKRHAQEVMRSITDMGVPASRLQVASSTDPNATASEVRVFVR
ncbi:MAG TPA: hypothetical protein VMF58_02610 [Rhizomicrobium sp.]|nr:hypothetical protein [Rhizomicrobium sp.]